MKHMFDCDMIKKGEKRSVTKADIYLILGILACALFLFLFFHLHREPGAYAEISYDGTLLKRISLLESEGKYYLIGEIPAAIADAAVLADTASAGSVLDTTENPGISIYELKREEWSALQEALLRTAENETGNYNVFMCQNGEVQMLGSNCPDKICVYHSAVGKTGENIICLPHKVVIEIVGGEDLELDGVVF